MSVLYTQISAEYKAVQLQAFNSATDYIYKLITSNKLTGNDAIILDIDETILDTSPYQSKLIIENKIWPYGEVDYLQNGLATPIPGSLKFLKYVDSLGIKIFYITNRKELYKQNLIRNLEKYGFPQVNNAQIICRQQDYSKEGRRKSVASKYNIIMLIGDSLNDFSNVFEETNNENRNRILSEYEESFGRKFIVLPNPVYGVWEDIIYNGNWKLPPTTMDSLRKETLKRLAK